MYRIFSIAVKVAATGAILVAGLLLSEPARSSALPSNGSLLVPGDVAPGNYWATPTDSIGGYVEVCADYACDVGTGMIENYSVDGRTMIVVPYDARMVNVSDALLTPVNVAPVPASRFPMLVPGGVTGLSSGDICSPLHATTQDGIGRAMWCNPLMTGDHSLVWMYGGPS